MNQSQLTASSMRQVKINNVNEAVSYLDSLLKYGMKPGLARIRYLVKKLGNPQFKYPVIQVAGTNGKSSVAKMIGAILTAGGFKTGVYLSPHLYDYTERFSVDGKNINKKDFLKTIKSVAKKAIESDRYTGDPLTNFEILSAIAYKYFADEKVDVAVVEVGLGGRFDATSVSSPSVCVVTNVEMDHVDVLGDKISKIANEKASIIKKGTRAVIGALNDEAISVVKRRIDDVGAEGFIAGRDFKIKTVKKLENGCYVADINGIYDQYKQITTTLPGRYQLENILIAIAASEVFVKSPLGTETLAEALPKVKLGGRLQVIKEKPKIIIDVSHNPMGMEKICQALSKDFKFKKLITVVAVYKDKDYKTIVKMLKEISDSLYLTQNYHERSASATELAGLYRSLPEGKARHAVRKSDKIKVEPSLENAIDYAIKEADDNDLICITGSFSTASVAGEYISKKYNDNK